MFIINKDRMNRGQAGRLTKIYTGAIKRSSDFIEVDATCIGGGDTKWFWLLAADVCCLFGGRFSLWLQKYWRVSFICLGLLNVIDAVVLWTVVKGDMEMTEAVEV
jgi:hypothetical protein